MCYDETSSASFPKATGLNRIEESVNVCTRRSVGQPLRNFRDEGREEGFKENPGSPHDGHSVSRH